jgi:hypothetical protein
VLTLTLPLLMSMLTSSLVSVGIHFVSVDIHRVGVDVGFTLSLMLAAPTLTLQVHVGVDL